MNSVFWAKNLNLISLILYLILFFMQSIGGVAGFFSGLLSGLLFPVVVIAIFIITIFDIITNPNSNPFNLLCLLFLVYLEELTFNKWPLIFSSFYISEDMLLYFMWLIYLLIILTLINNLKGNQIFKHSTLLILSYTLIFHNIITTYWLGNFDFRKNVITKKIGKTHKSCGFRKNECVETKIPRIYDSIEIVSSDLEKPVFCALKNGKRIFINRLNENLFPDSDNIEYIEGRLYFNYKGYKLFKVEKNKKYGLYRYKEGYSEGEIFIPLLYDEIQIIKDAEDIDKRGVNLIIIAKKSNLYDLYIERNYGFKRSYKDKILQLEKKNGKNGKQNKKYQLNKKHFISF